MNERRRGTRLRSAHQATIAWGAISQVNCVIQNFSAKGARLELPLPSNLPDRFDLIVERDQTVLHCRVKWRDGNGQTIGVEFQLQQGEQPVAAVGQVN